VTERRPDDIQRDIEQARVTLANAVDQIAYRTNPKRLVEQTKQTLKEKAQSPKGKAVLGGAGALVVILIIRRVRKHGK
jgi:Protein of unknown function (DUF3618)